MSVHIMCVNLTYHVNAGHTASGIQSTALQLQHCHWQQLSSLRSPLLIVTNNTCNILIIFITGTGSQL